MEVLRADEEIIRGQLGDLPSGQNEKFFVDSK